MSPDREPRERTLEMDRLVNFSDAVFAIAATVLVLSINYSHNLHQPDLDRKLWREFGDVLPQVLAYALSFFIIARNWFGPSPDVQHDPAHRRPVHRDQHHIARSRSRSLPYPTDVYGNYPSSRPALIVYAAISAPSIASAVLFRYATQDNRLIDPSTPREWIIHSQLRALSIPAVFLTSIPVSFIAVGLGQFWWLLLIPLRVYFTRRYGKITDVWDG